MSLAIGTNEGIVNITIKLSGKTHIQNLKLNYREIIVQANWSTLLPVRNKRVTPSDKINIPPLYNKSINSVLIHLDSGLNGLW